MPRRFAECVLRKLGKNQNTGVVSVTVPSLSERCPSRVRALSVGGDLAPIGAIPPASGVSAVSGIANNGRISNSARSQKLNRNNRFGPCGCLDAYSHSVMRPTLL